MAAVGLVKKGEAFLTTASALAKEGQSACSCPCLCWVMAAMTVECVCGVVSVLRVRACTHDARAERVWQCVCVRMTTTVGEPRRR